MAKPLNSWLNKDLLPTGVSTSEKKGLYAEFFPSGQLSHFASYNSDGEVAGWALYLVDGQEAGRAVLEAGSGGTPDFHVYRNGTYEVFDAWSDNTGPEPMEFELWVKKWIADIADNAVEKARRREKAEETKARIAKDGIRSVIKRVK